MDLSSLTDLFDRVVAAQPEPPPLLVAVTGVTALAGVVADPTWRVTRHVVTIAHEGGHALAALATRRRLTGIRLHSDTSGVTTSRGKPTGPGMAVTAAAGYLTPPLLGFGSAALLATGRVTALLWINVALLGAMLLMIRNAYGVVAVAGTGAVVFGASWFAPPDAQAGFAYVSAWFLLLGGTRQIAELQHARRRHRAPRSDADQLAELSGVPAIVWVALFAVASLAALLLGVRLMFPSGLAGTGTWEESAG